MYASGPQASAAVPHGQLSGQFHGPSSRPPPPADSSRRRWKLKEDLDSLLQNIALLKAIGDELEATQGLRGLAVELKDVVQESKTSIDESVEVEGLPDADVGSCNESQERLLETVRENVNRWPQSVSLAMQAAKQLEEVVKLQLRPFQEVLDGSPESGKAASLAKLAIQRKKLLRNRKWRTRQRRRVAEALEKQRGMYEDADRQADEWRAKEIAKAIAKRKMEKMKELAEKKAKEEKFRRQKEMETVVLVEKLQELRALRISKLKKQGRFFPEEDDEFMERVRAAVAEEERQAAAAANTSAAAAAILNAEEARKAGIGMGISGSKAVGLDKQESQAPTLAVSVKSEEQNLSGNNADKQLKTDTSKVDKRPTNADSEKKFSGLLEGYEGLPAEFQHYYLGSSFDIGTLIEVRQAWDAFIMHGGSRIPQHWVDAPPPADSVWASYIVKPKTRRRYRQLRQ